MYMLYFCVHIIMHTGRVQSCNIVYILHVDYMQYRRQPINEIKYNSE